MAKGETKVKFVGGVWDGEAFYELDGEQSLCSVHKK
mgnify:CR=1 FL=1